MVQVKEFITYIETLFPPAIQEDFDNNGLLIGNALSEVKGIIVCLNVTADVLSEAKNRNCNLILSHHPLIFKGLKKLTASTETEKIAETAIRENIVIYALHTVIDNVFPGLNSYIAHKAGLSDIKVFAPKTSMFRKLITFCPVEHSEKVRLSLFQAGAGVIGNYDSCSFNCEGYGTFRGSDITSPFVGKPGKLHHEKEIKIETIYPFYLQEKILNALFESHPYEEVAYDIYELKNDNPSCGIGATGYLKTPMNTEQFLKHIKSVFCTEMLKYSGSRSSPISKVAICGGNGAKLINLATSIKADAYVTADISYHEFNHGCDNFILIDAGHYETEIFFKEYVIELIKKNFTNLAIIFSENEKNYISYY